MPKVRDQKASNHTAIKLVTMLYSVIFVGSIAAGYYYLLQNMPLIGALIALILAAIAWNIARFLGGEDDGIRNHKPLFVLLLLLSAFGIFNTLMLNLEGRSIFNETVQQTEKQLSELAAAVRENMPIPAVEAKIAEVNSLQSLLIAEIKNPQRCGQGPAALEIMDKLRTILPAFQPLSQPNGNNCTQNDRLIASYRQTIKGLIENSDWYKAANYAQRMADQASIESDVAASREKLAQLRGRIDNARATTLLSEVKPQLEAIATDYNRNAALLKSYGKEDSVNDDLSLLAVQSLGEWSQLINVILSRLNKPSTYIYLLIAVFADWLMIYLFNLSRIKRVKDRSVRTSHNESVGVLR
jgi:hypothetical protein